MANRRLNGKLVTLFGGGGFVGRYIAQLLLADGARLRVAEREPKSAYAIRALGSLGQVQFVPADITKPNTVAAACAGADIVINLVGILNGDFEAVHVKGAENVAKAAKAAGADRMVHFSALGADLDSPSAYGRSKAEGEAAVRAAFPDATILRPSFIFGQEDKFTNRFAEYFCGFNAMPIVMGGTKMQPVYVEDVARAVHAAVVDPDNAAGNIYELGGPETTTMRGLLFWIGRACQQTVYPITIPDSISGLIAKATGWLPGAPITYDQWLMLQKDNVVADGAKTLTDLGVTPTPMSAVADSWMVQYRPHGRFDVKAKA